MKKKPVKPVSPSEALAKLQRYCAYQDRCHQEVRTKLISLGIYGDTLEQIIAELISEKFLDEERFARSYARGKFRVRQWGRKRIRMELKKRKVSDYCIRKGLEEIDEISYLDTLQKVLKKYGASLREKDPYKRKMKLAKYAMDRGFESELVWSQLK